MIATITCPGELDVCPIRFVSPLQRGQAKKLRDEMEKVLKTSMGDCCKLLEEHLQKLNIKRQAYHSSCFVGNHIHKMLEVCFCELTLD